jgi:hypothetical protein
MPRRGWTPAARRINGRRLERNRKFVDSPLEGTGFEPSVPRQEKWSMPNSSDKTLVGRTLTLEEVLSLPWRAETSNSRSRRKTFVLRPMISARTARIDDNLGRGTDGSNPLSSSEESGANLAFGGASHR